MLEVPLLHAGHQHVNGDRDPDLGFVISLPSWGQINNLTREEMIKYTAANPCDRFPDGRPKVFDALLDQFKDMFSEELMTAARAGGPSGGAAAAAGAP